MAADLARAGQVLHPRVPDPEVRLHPRVGGRRRRARARSPRRSTRSRTPAATSSSRSAAQTGGELAETCTSVSSLTAAYAERRHHLRHHPARLRHRGRARWTTRPRTPAATRPWPRCRRRTRPCRSTSPSRSTRTGCESNATALLKDAKSKGVKVSVVNIMTMDFGDGENALATTPSRPPTPRARQLASIYGGTSTAVWSMIGLTPIAGHERRQRELHPGQRSDAGELRGLEGRRELAFWEVDGYDKPIGYAYSRVFNEITGGGGGGGGGVSDGIALNKPTTASSSEAGRTRPRQPPTETARRAGRRPSAIRSGSRSTSAPPTTSRR